MAACVERLHNMYDVIDFHVEKHFKTFIYFFILYYNDDFCYLSRILKCYSLAKCCIDVAKSLNKYL